MSEVKKCPSCKNYNSNIPEHHYCNKHSDFAVRTWIDHVVAQSKASDDYEADSRECPLFDENEYTSGRRIVLTSGFWPDAKAGDEGVIWCGGVSQLGLALLVVNGHLLCAKLTDFRLLP